MYLQNKYTTWYYLIVEYARQNVNRDGYHEKHHIIPKSLGGSNNLDNIVKLSPKEHYICHLLLTKMVEGDEQRKMWFAAYMMMRGIRRHKPSARMYELLKQKMRDALKEKPGPNKGKIMSEEQKIKISLSQKGIPKGPFSDEHKEKLKKPKSPEHKKKISEARIGKSWGHKHSVETKKKMSEWQKGIPKSKIKCEHCDKVISNLNYQRWHGNRCKFK